MPTVRTRTGALAGAPGLQWETTRHPGDKTSGRDLSERTRKMQDRRQDFNTRVEALKLGMDDDLSCDRGAGQNPSTGPQQGDPGAGETGAG